MFFSLKKKNERKVFERSIDLSGAIPLNPESTTAISYRQQIPLAQELVFQEFLHQTRRLVVQQSFCKFKLAF